ncbi:MAG: hypothetical protein RIB58_09515 [Phycisphaerales bacterium]
MLINTNLIQRSKPHLREQGGNVPMIAALLAAAGLVMPLPMAAAQDTRNRQAIENPGEWEWQADEGYHKEEWYDPSDWFDGNEAIDYEYDWYEAVDYSTGRWSDTYDTAWYDGYWDGYEDGYHDDIYGYDAIIEFDSVYGDAYTSGYADGFYDSSVDFDYDPYYYVYVWDTPEARDSDRERAGDDTRERGDRALPSERSDSKTNQSASSSDAQKQMDIRRVRGTIGKTEYLRGSGKGNEKSLVARVTFEAKGDKESSTHVVNLGPKMSPSEVPFEAGDTVTFKGVDQDWDGRTILKAHKLNVNGESVRLASGPEAGWTREDTQFRGTIESISRVETETDRFTIMRVKLEDGSARMVAFPASAMSGRNRIEAGKGDDIMITGRKRMIDGREVIHPKRIRVNGERLSMR